jgi:hypothetical protein
VGAFDEKYFIAAFDYTILEGYAFQVGGGDILNQMKAARRG